MDESQFHETALHSATPGADPAAFCLQFLPKLHSADAGSSRLVRRYKDEEVPHYHMAASKPRAEPQTIRYEADARSTVRKDPLGISLRRSSGPG